MRFFWQMIVGFVFLAMPTAATLLAQSGVITLNNPSFEDLPRHSSAPQYWSDCGFPNESPPDVHPDFVFAVSKPAFDGKTYLGMVTRDNDTYERVGQQLSKPMQKGTCYEFSIKLARSLSYISISRETNTSANYTSPVKLRIWGGYGRCERKELLAESPLVNNPDWQEYFFKLSPDAPYTHIVLEAYYKTPTLFPTNGNLLLDDASSLAPMRCSDAVPEGPQTPKATEPMAAVTPRNPSVTPITPKQPTVPARSNDTANELAGVKRADMTTGKTILMADIQFEADSSRIIKSTVPALEELYNFLANNPDVSVEIGGHTSGWADAEYAQTLSTSRAKSVADYLTRRGINPARVKYKGYGKDKPIDTNDTATGRKRNQRVEIKILGAKPQGTQSGKR